MEEITTITNLEDFLKGIEEKKDYPKGLRLDLGDNRIGTEGTKALAAALQSGQCPQGLQLGLYGNQLGAEGAKALAIALRSGQCPQGLQLHLRYNQLGDDGAKALAMALHSGQCPRALQLDLSFNLIGTDGAKALATALQSGQCLQDLQLNLRDNQLGVEETKALAMALQSGQCPQRLQLNLANNQIGAEGAKALAIALRSEQCPQGLKLGLTYNRLGITAVKALATALRSRKCPQGLQLDLSCNYLGAEDEKILQKAWAVYYAHQQDNFIKGMTLYRGHGQVTSLINRLPLEILQKIYSYSLPATPMLAKMTEISTKVFRAQYATLKLADTSEPAKQFDKALETALSSKRVTEKAAKIKTAINDFLPKELGSLDTKKFIPSPIVALLCKYHLLAKNHVYQSPNQPYHFQLNEQALKKSTL